MNKITTLVAILASTAAFATAQTPVQAPANPAATPQADVDTRRVAVPQAETEFVKKAAVSGLYEVQSSQMATTASQSAEVQQFAQQMITDHTAANQQLQQLAASKNIEVPQTLDEKHQKMISRLQKATGEQFDTTYGRQQMKAHQEAVQLFQQAATNLTDPELKAFAETALPKLQQHAEMAKSLPGADETKADNQDKP